MDIPNFENLPFYKGSEKICIYPEALLRRPRIAALVSEAFNACSRADAHLTNILAATLNADEEIALEMFLLLNQESAKGTILDRLMKRNLSKDHFERFSALYKKYKKIKKLRNSFAHGIWTATDSLPAHELLLIDSTDYIRWHRRMNFTDKTRVEKDNKIVARIVSESVAGKYQENTHDISRDLNLFAIEIRSETM